MNSRIWTDIESAKIYPVPVSIPDLQIYEAKIKYWAEKLKYK